MQKVKNKKEFIKIILLKVLLIYFIFKQQIFSIEKSKFN